MIVVVPPTSLADTYLPIELEHQQTLILEISEC